MAFITNIARPADWVLVTTSGANAINSVAQPTPPVGFGLTNQLTALQVSWSGGAPAAGCNVQVFDGTSAGALLFDAYLGDVGGGTQGSVEFVFPSPLKSTPGNALTITVAAAGGTTTTKVCGQGVVFSTASL